MFENKRILVTGGTGSFGHQVAKDLIQHKPSKIVVFSRDEDKQNRMRYDLGKHVGLFEFIIGDVRDSQSVQKAMRGVDIVFHAAALKQVPSAEYNVMEAVKTNVLGAQNVFDAAIRENVEKVVAISTDKAVEPVNAMGISKAMQERLATTANLARGDARTVFANIRYGNVVGSRGSVVPLFRQQLRDGKDLTITDRTMTRFILTLPESTQLIFHAAKHGVGGETFVKKMPGHTVLELAEVLKEKFGTSKTKIVDVGIRPGEKLHETLVSPAESLRTVDAGDYYVILPQVTIPQTDLHYAKLKRMEELGRFASDNAPRLKPADIAEVLKKAGWFDNEPPSYSFGQLEINTSTETTK